MLSFRRFLRAVGCATLLLFLVFGSSPARADSLGLGGAGNFAVLGLLNTDLNFSNDTVTGNVGLSGTATLDNKAPSTIKGNVFKDATATVTNAGTITGSIITQSMTSINSDATTASTTYKNLAATQTFGSLSANTTITGNGGVNVIKINGDINFGGSDKLVLTGTMADIFIVNITGTLTANGSAMLGLGGGVTAGHVLYNFIGASGDVSLQVGNTVFGTLLGPNYSFSNADGTYNGALIFGGSQIKLLSGATVNYIPFIPTPEPLSATIGASMMLAALGVYGLNIMRKRRSRGAQTSPCEAA
jgi:choice-of-anchor A domain-containing protein